MPSRGTHWLGRFPLGRRERGERLGARLGQRCLYLTLPPGGARDLLEFKREAALGEGGPAAGRLRPGLHFNFFVEVQPRIPSSPSAGVGEALGVCACVCNVCTSKACVCGCVCSV